MASNFWSAAATFASSTARAAAASIFMGLAFGGLGFLARAEPAPDWRLVVEHDAERFALLFAIQCQFLWGAVALVSEWSILALRRLSPGRTLEDFWLPIVWALIGAILFFPQNEHGPRETLLTAGGALAGLLGGACLLWLRDVSTGRSPTSGSPTANWIWYGLVSVCAAGFLGGFRAWCEPSPHLQKLLDYRANRWSTPNHPKLPAPPVDPDDPAHQPRAASEPLRGPSGT